MHLYLGVDLDEAIRMKRFHHQLIPMAVQCELGMDAASEISYLWPHEGPSYSTF